MPRKRLYRLPWEQYSREGKDQRHTEAWKARRKMIITVRGGICERCKAPARDVHCRNGDHFDPDAGNFVLCCSKCHGQLDIEDGTPRCERKYQYCSRREAVKLAMRRYRARKKAKRSNL